MEDDDGDIEMAAFGGGFDRNRDDSTIQYHNFVDNDNDGENTSIAQEIPVVVNNNRFGKGSENLDHFLSNVYKYFLGKGFWSILLLHIVNLLQFGFMVLFATFLLSFVDYHVLLSELNWSEGIKLNLKRINPFLWIVLVIAGLFWWVLAIRNFFELKEMYHMKSYYKNVLHISERELLTFEWPQIVDRMTKNRLLGGLKEAWNPLDIAQRIMRKENYVIALFNKEILELQIPYFKTKYYTTLMEWSVKRVVFSHIFDSHFRVRREVVDSNTTLGSPVFKREVHELQKKFKWLGYMLLIFSPFSFILLVLYTIFRYGEEVRNRPSFLNTRQWSKYARWKFREFNELHHDFAIRLNKSHPHAQKYINQFTLQYLLIISRCLSFVAGSFVAVIIIITIFNDSVLQLSIGGKSMIWVLGFLGAVLAILKSLEPDEHAVFEADKHMKKTAKHTHYLPKKWREHPNLPEVYDKFAALFENRVIGFVRELLSIFIVPMFLIFILPKSADKIIIFFRKFTISVEGIGDVCAYSAFEYLDAFGNPKYGADVELQHKDLQSKQGKMEKSIINFKSTYKNWDVPISGKKMLANLARIIDPQQSKATLEDSVMDSLFL